MNIVNRVTIPATNLSQRCHYRGQSADGAYTTINQVFHVYLFIMIQPMGRCAAGWIIWLKPSVNLGVDTHRLFGNQAQIVVFSYLLTAFFLQPVKVRGIL